VDSISPSLNASEIEEKGHRIPQDLVQALLITKLKGMRGIDKRDECACHVRITSDPSTSPRSDGRVAAQSHPQTELVVSNMAGVEGKEQCLGRLATHKFGVQAARWPAWGIMRRILQLSSIG